MLFRAFKELFEAGGGACWDPVSFDTVGACTTGMEHAKQISTMLLNMGPFNNSNTRSALVTSKSYEERAIS